MTKKDVSRLSLCPSVKQVVLSIGLATTQIPGIVYALGKCVA
jgi:hypothetical protein